MILRRFLEAVAAPGLVLLASLLLGCGADGGDGSGDTVAEAPTGTVNILFTDAPSDDFSAINVTVSRIELLPFNDDDSDSDAGDDDSDSDSDSDSDRPAQRVTLFSGSATFDLLQLENFTNLFSITPDVPSGEYRKIRLTVSAIEMIDRYTGDTVVPDLPGNGRLDLVARHPFLVEPETTLLVTIDIDARRSVHVRPDGEGGYDFRPVVFVTVNNAPTGPGDPGDPGDPGTPPPAAVKFVRIQGAINRAVAGTNELGLQLGGFGGQQFTVLLEPGALIFAGTYTQFPPEPAYEVDVAVIPVDFNAQDRLGTVIGMFDEGDPTIFRAVIANLGSNADYAFAKLRGTARTVPVNGEFVFSPDNGADITVTLHPQALFFNNAGDMESIQAIQPDARLEIEVRPLNATGDRQQATMVVALTADVVSEQQVSGQIVDLTGDILTVATDIGDRCVNIGSAGILVNIQTPDGVFIGPGGVADLQLGKDVDASGIEGNDGCLQAQSVMVFTTVN